MKKSPSADSRRPRLLRASATEPSIITTAAVTESVGGARNRSSPLASDSTSYRRAADLLNHVVYISSCATSPNSVYSRRDSSSTAASTSPSSGSSPLSRRDAVPSACRPKADPDDVMASSPTSTNTSESVDDLHNHPHSGRYVSFPSFDTWDPDYQERVDEDEDDKLSRTG